jgi:hypothetical protein
MLYLWKIERTGSWGYDEYDAAVVVARTEDEARQVHPAGDFENGWVNNLESLKVTKLGTVARGSDLKAGAVVLASFNAG